MSDETPHMVLGVARTATAEEITAAYRKAAMHAHPDRGGTAEEFQRVKAAYEYALALVGVCETCNGSGVIEKAVALDPKKRRVIMDGFAVRVPCPTCRKK